ncbi:MAG: hypothetical protein NC200_06730 [Candidatus Gastranaerophilales bacterium]|nr:hypothetical protein [Candidatus Gastranaerophilales bacterium]
MKKFLVFICIFVATAIPTLADTMAVQAVTPISTERPDEILKVRVIRDCTLGDIELKIGYIIEGKMLTVTDPKRLKRDASFSFYPMNYIDSDGNSTHIPVLYIGNFTPKFEVDAGKLAKTAVLSVGDHFIKGISYGFYAVQGAVQNDDGNRISSAFNSVYKNSPLSYIEKGSQLDIKPSTCFGLKFKDCTNAPKADKEKQEDTSDKNDD